MRRLVLVLSLAALVISACQPSEEPMVVEVVVTATPEEEPIEESLSEEQMLEEPIFQEGSTDEQGRLTFSDPSTNEDVQITVVDADGRVLEGMKVIYQHGVAYQYEAFFVEDDSGELVGVDFFLHNSDHTIRVEPNIMLPANPDKAKAVTGYFADKTQEGEFYKDTITCGREDVNQESLKELLIHGGPHLVIHVISLPASIVFGLLQLKGDTPQEFYPCRQWGEGTWDWYHSRKNTSGYSRINTLVYVESQPPETPSVEIEVAADGKVTATMLSIDPTKYPTEQLLGSGKFDAVDHTIFLGQSEFSDIEYNHRVRSVSGVVIVDWEKTYVEGVCTLGNCKDTTVEFEIPASGEYTFVAYAVDEVGNTSDFARVSFTVGDVSRIEYSDLESFKLALKEAIESADSKALEELISDTVWVIISWSKEENLITKDRAIRLLIDPGPSKGTVDISERGDFLAGQLHLSGVDVPVPAYVLENFSHDDFVLLLSAEYTDGTWYLTSIHEVYIPKYEELHGPFPRIVGPPSTQYNHFDPKSIAEWTQYAVMAPDVSLFKNFVGPNGAVYAKYATDFFSPDYDNGEEIAKDMGPILEKASPVCLGYRSVGEDITGRLTVYFDGVSLEAAGMTSDTEVSQFLFMSFDTTGDPYFLMAIGSIPSWAVESETENLIPCPITSL